jgi:hypothetical protein
MMDSMHYNLFAILSVVSWVSGFNALTHLTYKEQVLISRLGSDTADVIAVSLLFRPFIYPYLLQNLQMHGFYLQCPIACCLKHKGNPHITWNIRRSHDMIPSGDSIHLHASHQNTGLRSIAVIDLEKAYDVITNQLQYAVTPTVL